MRENVVDILCVGAQKSATSWAAYALNLHPRTWIPKESAVAGKEVMFWDAHYKRGLDWYRETMTPPNEALKSMDISPGYSRIGAQKIAQCRKLSPTASVFFLARNPIYREWSSMMMEAGRRKMPLEEIKAMDFIDLLVFYDSANVRQYTSYVQTISLWKEAYGDRFMVGVYDDISNDSHAFYEKLCAHCGLDADEAPGWRSKIERRVFKGPDIELPPDMHEFLRRKHRPMIETLSTMLNRDLSDWLADNPSVQ
jgi:hypothetical protein